MSQTKQNEATLRSEEKIASVDLNKVLRWCRRQMRDNGTSDLAVISDATEHFGLSTNQSLAVAAALGQELYS